MAKQQRIYAAIDLKSFYASVECVDRGLDPLTTNLVVADKARSEKTICLAVSPSLKAYGISGRARLFEVVQKVREVNAQRRCKVPGRIFRAKSPHDPDVQADPSVELDYIVAVPRMARYIEMSTVIYDIYLQFAAPEDIHVYSIDEVFVDVTDYLHAAGTDAHEYVRRMIRAVYEKTRITAAAGIGTNLYLCKVAMDIVAKHVTPDEDGVRIAHLDEMTYRRMLWGHKPLTDFWRVGRGYVKKLEACGLYTMGDIARCSLGKANEYYNEDLLFKLFGVNAELLIDHAWGYEPCTIADVKAYQPEYNSLGAGQVLPCSYTAEKALLVVKEMADSLALDLVNKGLVTKQLVLTVGYDAVNLKPGDRSDGERYQGEVTIDMYGRKIPKHAHGTINLERYTSSAQRFITAVEELYRQIVDERLMVHRVNLTANHVIAEQAVKQGKKTEQLDLFFDYEAEEKRQAEEQAELDKEKRKQQAMLEIKQKFGKNAILRGMSLEEGATARDRNKQIGGHKA